MKPVRSGLFGVEVGVGVTIGVVKKATRFRTFENNYVQFKLKIKDREGK